MTCTCSCIGCTKRYTVEQIEEREKARLEYMDLLRRVKRKNIFTGKMG